MPSFSNTLEQAIHAALALANSRSHEFATLEHLLLALIDEPDAARVMKACSVDTEELRTTLVEFSTRRRCWARAGRSRYRSVGRPAV